jgi:hypothetical protein
VSATDSADNFVINDDIEPNPLYAALAAVFRVTTSKRFADACAVLADLANAGEMDRIAAVDRAQNLAVASGLIETIGQDAVQAIMARAFQRCRPTAEPKRAAEATVEALMYSLRQRGAAALAERDGQRRLAEMSSDQVRMVIARLIKLRPSYPAITDALLFRLGGQL